MIAVTSNLDEVIKSLEAWHKEAVRKMEGMVQAFSYRMTISAINATPLGDSTKEKNAQWYLDRVFKNPYGGLKLSPIEGFARGSWQATPDSDGVINTTLQEYYGKDAGDDALRSVERSMSYYKIGQTVFITNTGPYINYLEKNYSDQTNKQGIMEPTINMVESAISSDLSYFYKKA